MKKSAAKIIASVLVIVMALFNPARTLVSKAADAPV